MSAATANIDTPKINGNWLPAGAGAKLTIAAAAVLYAGTMLAQASDGKVTPGADTLGLRILGRVPIKVDNTADGLLTEVEYGVFRYANDGTNPVSRANIGQVCYASDDKTVASTSTNLVAAGLVYDVDADGVWVEQTPQALAAARAQARPKVVSVTDDVTATAAQCWQGNVILACDKASAMTVTLPSAALGYRLGVQRLSATAAHDVSIKAASADTVLGSAASKQVDNAVDAISAVLWLETTGAVAWVLAAPAAYDRASWAINNA